MGCSIYCAIWMNFKSITCTSYIFFPPLIFARIIFPCNTPIISITITLPYPRSINAAAARTLPSLFCFWFDIWAFIGCARARSCSCNFICSSHNYLHSDTSSSLEVPYCFCNIGKISSNELCSI